MNYNIFFIFLLIFLYKLLNNGYKAYRCNKLYNEYCNWLMNNGSYDISHTIAEVTELLKEYEDNFIPLVQPAGFGVIHNMKVRILSQYPSRVHDIAAAQANLFSSAISQYQYKVKQCFNPLYWIDLVIWFPKNIVSFLGISEELKSVKVINIILQLGYWILLLIQWLGLDFKVLLLQILSN